MRAAFPIAIVAALVAACSVGETALSDSERELISELGFDESLMSRIKSLGESYERLTGITRDFEPLPANGLVLITAPDRGRAVLKRIKSELGGSPYRAYLNDEAFGHGADRVAIVRSEDQYAYLAVIRTDGINYDIDHEQVLARYRDWDRKYGLSLVGAGQDWLEAELRTPPSDWITFAQEVYDFCPDVVDQGAGNVAALAAEMRAAKTLYLWWD